jgi:hypothetical protein
MEPTRLCAAIWRPAGSGLTSSPIPCGFTRSARAPEMTQAIPFRHCRRWWDLLNMF